MNYINIKKEPFLLFVGLHWGFHTRDKDRERGIYHEPSTSMANLTKIKKNQSQLNFRMKETTTWLLSPSNWKMSCLDKSCFFHPKISLSFFPVLIAFAMYEMCNKTHTKNNLKLRKPPKKPKLTIWTKKRSEEAHLPI